MIAAAFGGMVWCVLDFRLERRWSMVGFCSGTIAGLVAATPSSGYLRPWSSVVVGVLAGILCNFATKGVFFQRRILSSEPGFSFCKIIQSSFYCESMTRSIYSLSTLLVASLV
jgi:flagellar biosynthesis protein FliR